MTVGMMFPRVEFSQPCPDLDGARAVRQESERGKLGTREDIREAAAIAECTCTAFHIHEVISEKYEAGKVCRQDKMRPRVVEDAQEVLILDPGDPRFEKR